MVSLVKHSLSDTLTIKQIQVKRKFLFFLSSECTFFARLTHHRETATQLIFDQVQKGIVAADMICPRL